MNESRVYCTVQPHHADGEHTADCVPPADPANPELRLIRAIWGLCSYCNRTDEHEHTEDPRGEGHCYFYPMRDCPAPGVPECGRICERIRRAIPQESE